MIQCLSIAHKPSINPIIWGFAVLVHFGTLAWHSALKECSFSQGESSFLQHVKISGVFSTSVSVRRAGNSTVVLNGHADVDAKLPSYFINLVKYFDWF